MTVLRFLSALFFLIALVALAADAAPLLSSQADIKTTSVLQRWGEISPAVLSSAKQSLESKGLGWVWTSVLVPLFSVPAFAGFGLLGLLFGYAGRRRRRINVFIN
jgi:hypothetical protein